MPIVLYVIIIHESPVYSYNYDKWEICLEASLRLIWVIWEIIASASLFMHMCG